MSDSTDLRVLIIDHHRIFVESLAQVLTQDGISVLGNASSGSEGIALAARLHPKVVLVNYVMPDRNGVEVVAGIKQRDPEIVVVMLTESTEDQVLVAAIDAGCSGFLTKDLAASEVTEAVRLAAVGETVISPASLERLLPHLGPSRGTLGFDLTPRERDVLEELARGWSNKAIASDLHLSLNTVRNYSQRVLIKLGAHSKLEAVATAVRQGIITY
jgi:DNA-binding NarL/FixJ family response regulator